VGDGAFVFGWPNWANCNKAISAFLLAPLEFAGAGDMLKQVISQLCCAPVELDHRLIVSNSSRGYHFYSEVGTRLKFVGFNEVVPVRVATDIFSRIGLTTCLSDP
jgi:hypothetical protein